MRKEEAGTVAAEIIKLHEKSLLYKQEVYVEIADKILEQIMAEYEMTALDFKNLMKVLESRGLDRAKL